MNIGPSFFTHIFTGQMNHTIDSTKTLLSELLPADKAPLTFEYEYDFGDSWLHDVLFEGSPAPQPGKCATTLRTAATTSSMSRGVMNFGPPKA